MKILFVANVAKEHINKFHIPTIKEFKKHGWTVDVACSGEDEVPECDKRFKTCWKRSPFTLKTIKGIIELKKIIEKYNYDVIYCHTPVGGLIGRLAARKARKNGTKVVYCAHGLHFFKGAPIINWIIYYPFEKILAHFTDIMLLVNKEDYDIVSRKFTQKTKYVLAPEVGVNFDRLNIKNPELTRDIYRKRLNISKETTVLIYVAELIPNKNQRMLVDVLKVLLDAGKDVKLLLPGPDHSNGQLKRYIEDKELENYVELLGWRNDIGELLYASDICIASSIREGFGINLVEAMYCGLPVVAVDNRGHKMIIEDSVNGYLVNLNDVNSMADRISLLINNKDIYNKMTNIDVSEYDCEVVASKLFNIISR